MTSKESQARIRASLSKTPYTHEQLMNAPKPKTAKEKAFFRTWGYLPTWRKL